MYIFGHNNKILGKFKILSKSRPLNCYRCVGGTEDGNFKQAQSK